MQAAEERVQRLTAALQQAVQGWRFEAVVAALRALRGIDTVSAIGLVCEIGDIGRFAAACQLMATSDSCPRNIPAATVCAAAQSPRPAMHTRGAC